MDERELQRREREDVCTHCGWYAVLMDGYFECVNDRCFGYREKQVIKKVIRHRPPPQP